MAMSVVYTTLGGRIVYENRGGVERSYLRDPLGNTVGLMDMSGSVTDTFDYWPYGETRVHSGSSKTPLTFLGTLGYFTDYLNMLYVRARHLRVDLTTWMTVDPLWPSIHAYAYASLRPTTRTDPTGRAPDIGDCLGKAFSAFNIAFGACMKSSEVGGWCLACLLAAIGSCAENIAGCWETIMACLDFACSAAVRKCLVVALGSALFALAECLGVDCLTNPNEPPQPPIVLPITPTSGPPYMVTCLMECANAPDFTQCYSDCVNRFFKGRP